MKKNNLAFIAACFGMFLFGIAMLSLGTINTFLVDKFQLDKLSAGSLASLLPLGILIGSLFFGAIVDRFGYKLLLIISALLIIASMVTIVYAGSFPLIQGAFFLIGITGGLINGATNALAADVSSENKSAKLSLLGVFYGLGAISLPLITGLLTKQFTYESVILGTAIFLVLPVVYFMIIPFPLPKQQQGIPLKKVFSMFKDKVLILFSFVLFFQSATEGISNNWTTSYLKDIHGLADDKALFFTYYAGYRNDLCTALAQFYPQKDGAHPCFFPVLRIDRDSFAYAAFIRISGNDMGSLFPSRYGTGIGLPGHAGIRGRTLRGTLRNCFLLCLGDSSSWKHIIEPFGRPCVKNLGNSTYYDHCHRRRSHDVPAGDPGL
jgi:MFS family permease